MLNWSDWKSNTRWSPAFPTMKHEKQKMNRRKRWSRRQILRQSQQSISLWCLHSTLLFFVFFVFFLPASAAIKHDECGQANSEFQRKTVPQHGQSSTCSIRLPTSIYVASHSIFQLHFLPFYGLGRQCFVSYSESRSLWFRCAMVEQSSVKFLIAGVSRWASESLWRERRIKPDRTTLLLEVELNNHWANEVALQLVPLFSNVKKGTFLVYTVFFSFCRWIRVEFHIRQLQLQAEKCKAIGRATQGKARDKVGVCVSIKL